MRFAAVFVTSFAFATESYIDKSLKLGAPVLNEQTHLSLESTLLVLLSLMIAILFMFFIFIKIQKRRQKKLFTTKRSRTIKKPFYMAKIDTSPIVHKPHDGDIVQELSFYFQMLHKINATNNNTVVFDYDIRYFRNYMADYHTILYMIHGIVEFLTNSTKNSTIAIVFKHIEEIEGKIKFSVSIKLHGDFTGHGNMIRMSIAGTNKNIYYKKLSLACYRAKILGTNIKYTSNKSESEFVFELNLTPTKEIPRYHFQNTDKQTTAIIAEDNKNSYNILRSQLEYYGVKIEPNSSWSIIKRHITDTIFRPNIVFIQAKIIKKLPIQELNMLKEYKERKNISVVIISNNENFDKIQENIKFDTYTLKQPYTSDTLLAILNKTVEETLWRGNGGV
ncbi:hypothetical protein [Campylobacter hyointestinalis]|uniref:hypothetical protein n=1 Tax=Campylobacter hyointestinalis TaxID=198 RepID=UPI000CE45329|nr:hypothetical protein [Campylobacter hyointestinalis]PPB53773.1 hypothetical protein CDQ69_05445 [Campylobacter hyointestinalis subsp. hyointestinalis]PPB60590.1 hypothetical protein CDQ72_07210 [Campylobacter hyointestinalis subsp. hyointestinalis]PPB62973.1 hypothetical protein CDQ73_06415 [Campylobacter hyointestinalis subsp. hyointestinalis]PPB69884.1 hypothetical protein CDQ77_04840 [Campylobacter hyointestinalis subsp. hyointestinalis]